MKIIEKNVIDVITQGDEIGTIVLLHGYGADSEDMNFLAKHWEKMTPNWKIISINGPIALNPGYAWFDLYSSNWLDDIEKSALYVEEMFSSYDKKLIFAGFSQGAFLSSYMGLYSKLQIDGCICFSGGIIPINKVPKQTPMFLIHGDSDEVIQKDWYMQSMSFAKENSLPIDGNLIRNMEHEINEEAFLSATESLKKLLHPVFF